MPEYLMEFCKATLTFEVCRRNPMMWPFKWKLSACTFTWCYLFVKILENEMWKFGRNLPLATFGSERVKAQHPLQILQTDLHSFPVRISGENLIKDQSIFPLIVNLFTLTKFILGDVFILLGENWFSSRLRLETAQRLSDSSSPVSS